MHTDDFEHLTHREWREILRWRAWDAKIALDQAVEARRKAVADYREGEDATLDDWTDLRQALDTESKARQKYHNALADYNSSSLGILPDPGAWDSSPRNGLLETCLPASLNIKVSEATPTKALDCAQGIRG